MAEVQPRGIRQRMWDNSVGMLRQRRRKRNNEGVPSDDSLMSMVQAQSPDGSDALQSPVGSDSLTVPQEPEPQQTVVTADSTRNQIQDDRALIEQIHQESINAQQAEREAEEEKKEQEGAKRAARQGSTEPQPEPEGDPRPSPFMDQLERQFEDIDNETQTYINRLNGLAARMDERHQQEVASIQSNYDRRRAELKELIRRRVSAQETIGLRSGRARFAQEVHQSVINTEEERGLELLAELDMEEGAQMSEAMRAAEDQDWELFTERMDAFRERRREKNQLTEQLHSMAVEEENQRMRRAQEQRSEEKHEFNMRIENREQMLNQFDRFVEAGVTPNANDFDQMSAATGLDASILAGMYRDRKQKRELERQGVELDLQLTQAQIQRARQQAADTAKEEGINTPNLYGFTESESRWILNPAHKTEVDERGNIRGNYPEDWPSQLESRGIDPGNDQERLELWHEKRRSAINYHKQVDEEVGITPLERAFRNLDAFGN